MTERRAKDVIDELLRRQQAGDGTIVEHWACRDGLGLLEQLHTAGSSQRAPG
ncbi:MAG: hypothetical protein ACHQSE_15860 [Gemmatimonadales bacterium]